MKKASVFTIALVLLSLLSSCGNLVKLTEKDGKLFDEANGITYVGAPICFEPITLSAEPYAKCRATKLEYYKIVGQPTSLWISEPFDGIGGLYYAEGEITLPSLSEFDADSVTICVEDAITVGIAFVIEKEDVAAIVEAFTEGSPTAIVQAGVSYKLKFSSSLSDYEGIYYNLLYVEGDDGENYIYDRSTQTCVNVGDVLQAYLPREREA